MSTQMLRNAKLNTTNLINTNKGTLVLYGKPYTTSCPEKSHFSPSSIEANGVSHTDPKSIAE